MSLIPFTCDIERDVTAIDDYGGETAVSGIVYSGLSVTFNYFTGGGRQRGEKQRFEATSQIRGPGLETRTLGVVIFDPKPDGVVILVDDRIVPNPAVTGIPASLEVLEIRTYEYTLQLDVESVDP